VVLAPDYTWRSVAGCDSITAAESRRLSNGRLVIIRPDRSWYFSEGRDGSLEEYNLTLSIVYAVGAARRKDYRLALAAARREALRRLTIQFASARPAGQGNERLLYECLEAQPKAEEITKKSTGVWDVSVRLTIDRTAILRILACEELAGVRR
jgi:hypothetical protein